MIVVCFLVTDGGMGNFAKCNHTNGYCVKRFVKRRGLTKPWNASHLAIIFKLRR